MPASDPAIALFLDFDGTLAEIAERPDAVVVRPETLARLSELRDRLGGALAIVTGRPLADVDGFLPGLCLDGCGLHGLERRMRGTTTRPALPDLGPRLVRLRERLAAHPGTLIEDKGLSLSVHWREAPDAEGAVMAAVDELAAELGPSYRVQAGKAVREVVPEQSGKGHGIRALLAEPPFRGRRPVFAGDDVTDEDGFRAVNELGGTSIKVGHGSTTARRRVADPLALARWLDGPLDAERLPTA